MSKYTRYIPFFIIVLGGLLFIPGLGKVHLFDWDEINFAEAAREMIVTGNYMQVTIDFQPFWEKPPLFIWMQALSMNLFGINEFAARFPNAVVGITSLLIIYFIGKRERSTRLGVLWVFAYAGSFLPHLYFRSGIIDPTFNLFIFLGIYFIYRHYKESAALKYLITAGIFTGAAVLTKGPVALLLIGVSWICFWVINRKKIAFPWKPALIYAVPVLLVSFAWFIPDLIKNGPSFIVDFFTYQIRLLKTEDAGHGGPFYYHFVVLLTGCFPASIFALGALTKRETYSSANYFIIWMVILFFTVLIIFSLVQTKIVHYSSLCYFPLTFLAALYLDNILNKTRHKKWLNLLLIIIGLLLGTSFILLPLIGLNINKLTTLITIKDEFAKASLQASVHWLVYEIFIGISFAILVMISFYLFVRKKFISGIITLFGSTTILISMILFQFVPKIERYSQGAAIDFYKSISKEDNYVEVLGFKSYAHLFYTEKQPPNGKITTIPYHERRMWLLTKVIDKPVYFVTKVGKLHQIKQYTDLKVVDTKNGFVFLKKSALQPRNHLGKPK